MDSRKLKPGDLVRCSVKDKVYAHPFEPCLVVITENCSWNIRGSVVDQDEEEPSSQKGFGQTGKDDWAFAHCGHHIDLIEKENQEVGE